MGCAASAGWFLRGRSRFDERVLVGYCVRPRRRKRLQQLAHHDDGGHVRPGFGALVARVPRFCKHFGIDKLGDLPSNRWDEAKRMIDEKRKAHG